MSRINSSNNLGGFGGIVNGLAVLVTLARIGAGDVAARSSFGGLA